jgi:DNA-binding transcriptional LysR family regulator
MSRQLGTEVATSSVHAPGDDDLGQLVFVLADWCPPIPGLALYYPGNRHVPSTLRAFIDLLKKVNGKLDQQRHPKALP